jgi:hypothetical protein
LLIYPPGYTLSRQIKGLTGGKARFLQTVSFAQLAMVGIVLAMIAILLGVEAAIAMAPRATEIRFATAV